MLGSKHYYFMLLGAFFFSLSYFFQHLVLVNIQNFQMYQNSLNYYKAKPRELKGTRALMSSKPSKQTKNE